MKAPVPFLAILAALIFGGLAHATLRAEERERTVEQWIEQLRSDDFDQRQMAAKKLESFGDTARVALEKVARDEDADLRAMAAKLLARLSKATLLLRVVDPDGEPVANGEGELIFIGEYTGGRNGPQTTPVPLKLDGEGRASVKLGSFGAVNFQLKLTGFIEGSNYGNINAHSGVNHLVMTVSRGGKAAGIVVGEDGKPIKDASVILVPGMRFDSEMFELQLQFLTQNIGLPGEEGGSTKGSTGEDGTWKLENVAEGVYTPVIQMEGHAPAMGEMVRVREGETSKSVQIALKTRLPGKLEFTLKKADGTPHAKRTVTVQLTRVQMGPKTAMLQALLRNGPANSQEKESNENGRVEIEGLAPGRYRLVVSGEPTEDAKNSDGGILVQSEIEIKSGETTHAEQKKPQKFGSIKGRILGENGKGLRDMPVRIFEQEALLESLENPIEEGPFGHNTQTEANTDNKGGYRFENLLPGKYAIVFKPNSDSDEGHQNYIFGIEVEPGKKTVAPEATLKSSAAGTPSTLKGRVFMPDGSPAKRAEIHYISNYMNTAFNTGDDGNFEFLAVRPMAKAGDEKPHEYFGIRVPNCKPLVVEGPLDATKDYRLEAQDYGSLRVTVTDEKGKPLPGVRVSAVGAPNNFVNDLDPFKGEPPRAQPVVTNVKGVARLTGLAVGKREMGIVYPGYWVPQKDAEFELTANAEKEHTMALRRGVTITGRVRGPNGATLAGAMAILNGTRYELAGADGLFSFTGVIPGECTITAWAPGLLTKSPVTILLPRDVEKLNAAVKEAVVVDLVRPGGIAIDCGKEFAGHSAMLVPFNGGDPAPVDLQDASRNGSGVIDASGRAEFWNVAPGSYRMSLIENDWLSMTASEHHIAALPSAGPFDVKALESREKLAALPPIKAELKRGTGSASGRLRMNPQEGIEGGFSISLRIEGEAATASSEMSEQAESFWQPYEPPQVFGTPPENFKPHVPGSFEVGGLPPGNYTVTAAVNFYEADDAEGTAAIRMPKPIKIASFTIKAGEKVELGELKLDTQEKAAPGKPNAVLKNLLRPLDRPQEFEP